MLKSGELAPIRLLAKIESLEGRIWVLERLSAMERRRSDAMTRRSLLRGWRRRAITRLLATERLTHSEIAAIFDVSETRVRQLAKK